MSSVCRVSVDANVCVLCRCRCKCRVADAQTCGDGGGDAEWRSNMQTAMGQDQGGPSAGMDTG